MSQTQCWRVVAFQSRHEQPSRRRGTNQKVISGQDEGDRVSQNKRQSQASNSSIGSANSNASKRQKTVRPNEADYEKRCVKNRNQQSTQAIIATNEDERRHISFNGATRLSDQVHRLDAVDWPTSGQWLWTESERQMSPKTIERQDNGRQVPTKRQLTRSKSFACIPPQCLVAAKALAALIQIIALGLAISKTTLASSLGGGELASGHRELLLNMYRDVIEPTVEFGDHSVSATSRLDHQEQLQHHEKLTIGQHQSQAVVHQDSMGERGVGGAHRAVDVDFARRSREHELGGAAAQQSVALIEPNHWTTSPQLQSDLTSDVQQNLQADHLGQMSFSATTPTLNRQISAPPLVQQQQHQQQQQSFFQFGLIPTNALQLEPLVFTNTDSKVHQNQAPATLRSSFLPHAIHTNIHHQLRPTNHQQMAESVVRPTMVAPSGLGDFGPPATSSARNSSSLQAASRAHRQLSTGNVDNLQQHSSSSPSADHQQQRDSSGSMSNGVGDAPTNLEQSSSSNEEAKAAASSATNSNEHQQAIDKGIEPRQRRRLFNRILKKAEWNHLFFELSKVFLRYFLDLALKDIIGKQSGATTSSGGETGRKKLDAQSELADLLRDSIKTAISNI